MQSPAAHMLDARRLHLHHGPIDLVIEAWGRDWQRALIQAEARFQTVLQELVNELDLLRQPLGVARPNGRIAQNMAEACEKMPGFVTPMAAVAGAVADRVLAAMLADSDLERAYVNNGGDIAFHLAPGHSLNAAIAGSGEVLLQFDQPGRGLASSGWRGRSHSLGIADTVSVVAKTAAAADVAATLIANAIDLPGHDAIRRQPACDLSPDSDLGARLVTVEVGRLSRAEIEHALTGGRHVAAGMLARGQITAAALFLETQNVILGDFPGPIKKEAKDARLQTA